PGKAGLTRIDLSDQRGTTGVRGRFERMGSNDGSGEDGFSTDFGQQPNLRGGRRCLSQVQDATQKALVFVMAVGKTGRFQLQRGVSGRRHPLRYGMMMQDRGKDV